MPTSTSVYPDQPNPDLLDRIPLDARTILDVGCGTGALGLEYKRRNPAARVYGIEASATATIAAARLDAVATTDVEANPTPFGDTMFDCIIYGDVLEHLVDPWRILRLHAERLSPHGVMLICMPNAEHWQFAERLLRGTFDYEPQGLFDRTHLRWFTAETTRRALRAAGLVPHDVIPRIFGRAQADEFIRAVRPTLAILGIDAAHYATRATPLQHVWRATKHKIETLSITSSMLNPVGGVSHVRVLEPLAALASRPGILTRVVEDLDPGADEPDLENPDIPRIHIFHRPLLAGAHGLAIVRRLLDRGYLVICEFDDHPAYIPVLQRDDVQNFRAVHAVQTSTEPLAEVLRAENPEIGVFPAFCGGSPPPLGVFAYRCFTYRRKHGEINGVLDFPVIPITSRLQRFHPCLSAFIRQIRWARAKE